jgi:hypothetical protein
MHASFLDLCLLAEDDNGAYGAHLLGWPELDGGDAAAEEVLERHKEAAWTRWWFLGGTGAQARWR